MRCASLINLTRGLVLLGLLAAGPAARTDTIKTKDGQTFIGQVLEQTNNWVRLRTDYGELKVPAAQVSKHERALYLVTLVNGTNLIGQITGETGTELILQVEKQTQTLPLAQVKDVSLQKPPPVPPPPPDARLLAQWHQQAMGLLAKKEYAKAIAKYEEILKAEPKDPMALYNVACAYALTGNRTNALERLRKSVEEGFVSFAHIERDPDLDSLRQEEAYKALFTRKDEYVRQASERAVKRITESLAKQKIDAKAYKTVYDEDRHFVYLHAKSDEDFARVRQGLEEFAACLWRDLFTHKVTDPLYIVLLTPADSTKALPNGVGGYFNHGANTLFCGDMPSFKLMRSSVVFHEFTHALHWADQVPRRQQHPIWITEGLSTLFETTQRTEGKLTPLASQRLSLAKQAAALDRTIPWAVFTKLSHPQFMANARLAYSQARSMLFYLHEKGLLKAFYDEYVKDASYAGDKSALEAFEVAFGKPASEVERDWKEWAKKLEIPAIPYLGLGTQEKEQKLIVNNVATNSPAAVAGLLTNDAILAIEGTRIQTQADFLEAIGNHAVGEEIDIRLERDGKPLDVTVKLGARPEGTARSKEKAPYLGLSVVESDREVQVREVDQGSPAEKAGLKPGWRIVRFAQTDIQTVRDFLNVVKKSKPGETQELTIREPNGKQSVLKLEVGTVAAEARE